MMVFQMRTIFREKCEESLNIMQTRIYVDLVLNDWCWIRMEWNVVWPSPFQDCDAKLFSPANGRSNFSYLIHFDKIRENREILIASTVLP